MSFKNMSKLSERLKFVRQKYNLSQVELAEKAGTTQQAIQQAEKGKARQPRYLHRLAQNLEISIEWMVFGEAQEDLKQSTAKKLNGLSDASSDVLNSFFSMPEKDQKLIYELMQSRKKD